MLYAFEKYNYNNTELVMNNSEFLYFLNFIVSGNFTYLFKRKKSITFW